MSRPTPNMASQAIVASRLSDAAVLHAGRGLGHGPLFDETILSDLTIHVGQSVALWNGQHCPKESR